MYRVSRRVLKFAALASAISIAALAAPTPAGLPTLADLGAAGIRPLTAFATGTPISLVKLAAIEAARLKPAPAKNYADIDHLPAAGAIKLAAADLTAPHKSLLPGQRFTVRLARNFAATKIGYTTFVKPVLDDHRAIAFVRLPHAKPNAAISIALNDIPNVGADVLAYAPSASGIAAPFDIVMSGGARIVEDDGLYRPRPRPDPTGVLAWLEGRALGQFAPGQHDWVQNQLPVSVFTKKEQKCLAEGVYFEARGEPEEGQAAVAQVILNRVRNPAYPKTICGVVYQNEWRRHACQFSFACDGRSEVITERVQWDEARRVAADVTAGRIWIPEVGDSTHYHARYVRPGWGYQMIKVDNIGAHIFYRTRFGGWS